MSSINNSSKSPERQNYRGEVKVDSKNSRRSAFAQILATLIQNWLLINVGLQYSMPTVVIGALHRNPNASLSMDDDQASWFGSIISFCHPIGSLSSGLFQEHFGRRGSTVLINIPIFAAWITLYFANSISALYAASTIMGLCIGLAEAPLHSYVGEIGEPRYRGTLSTLSTSAAVIEGPPVKKDGYFMTQLREMKKKKVLLPLRMVFIVFAINMTAYLAGIRPYLINEFKDLGAPIDSKLILIISQILFFVGAMINVVFLRRFGKRKLALFSTTITAASIFVFGFYCSHLKNYSQFPALVWTPVAIFLLITLLSGFSLCTLPWQFVCELFPLGARGTATGISAAWCHFVDFVLVKSFLYIEAWIHLSGVMYFYGVCTVLGLVYCYFHLPETEGKTLAQIELYFTKNHDRKEKFEIGKSRTATDQDSA